MDVRTQWEQAACSQGLLTRTQLRAAGVSEGALHRAVARGQVLRVRSAVYALEPLPPMPRHVVTDQGVAPAYVAHVRAALLSLGARASACDRSAAALYGWPLLVEPRRIVDVAVEHGRWGVSTPAVRPRQRRNLVRMQVEVLPGTDPLWLTAPLQTAVDCALRLPLPEAVVACDSALRSSQVTADELAAVPGRLPGVRQARRVDRVVELADARAASVLESVHRVRMVLAGIEGFDLQVVVRDRPELRVDFCFRAVGLVVEVDGAKWHPDPARDQARDNALVALGWRVLRYTWAEVVHDSERVLAEIAAAVGSGGPSVHLQGELQRVAA